MVFPSEFRPAEAQSAALNGLSVNSPIIIRFNQKSRTTNHFNVRSAGAADIYTQKVELSRKIKNKHTETNAIMQIFKVCIKLFVLAGQHDEDVNVSDL